MCTAIHTDTGHAAATNPAASRRSDREAALSAQSNAGPQIHPAAPEAIVGELVKQYFHCSTTISGIFRCW